MADNYKRWKEDRIRATGEVSPDDWLEYEKLSEDWSDSYDDMDGEAWAQYLGGPDDSEFQMEPPEPEYWNAYEEEGVIDQEDGMYIDLVEDCEPEDPRKIDPDPSKVQRVTEIVNWLKSSELAIHIPDSRNFFVQKGVFVRLQSGESYDAVDWLTREGVLEIDQVDGYKAVHSFAGSTGEERLTFVRACVEAPFWPDPMVDLKPVEEVHNHDAGPEGLEDDDELPF